jgi:hypothetical protein
VFLYLLEVMPNEETASKVRRNFELEIQRLSECWHAKLSAHTRARLLRGDATINSQTKRFLRLHWGRKGMRKTHQAEGALPATWKQKADHATKLLLLMTPTPLTGSRDSIKYVAEPLEQAKGV